jgi:hypothetical protein
VQRLPGEGDVHLVGMTVNVAAQPIVVAQRMGHLKGELFGYLNDTHFFTIL